MNFPIDITQYLPHRAPFLMVDAITALDENQVVTQFVLKSDNIFVNTEGYFSEPGLIENAAQTCAAIVARPYFADETGGEISGSGVVGFISAIKTLQIHGLPGIGTCIASTATLISKFVTDEYSLCTMACRIKNGDELFLEGEINLFIQRQPPAGVAHSNV